MKKKRIGVVLAAGLGSRLAASASGGEVKPLVAVDGRALLLRTLASLERACDRAVIVLGFAAEEIRASIEQHYQGPMALIFALNNRYHLANGLSVLAAREYVQGDFLLCMADHIMDDALLCLARDTEPPLGGAALLVDYKLATIFDMDDATKILAADGRILAIGKQLQEFNCIDTGLFVATPALFTALADVFRERGDATLSDGVFRLCRQRTMAAIDIGDGFWQDVDTVEMLHHAEEALRRRIPPLGHRQA
nr:NTP transferase domain-containing protein [uncultured Desulfobulbus sp.]